MQFDPHALLESTKPFVPSILGATLGILHNRERPLLERLVAVATGMAVAHFIGSGLVAYFGVTNAAIGDAVKFSLGLFGMSIVHAIYEQIQPFWQSLRERLVSLIGAPK